MIGEKHNNPAWAIIAWTFIFSIGYAIVRYHIVGTVPWKELVFFILNKSIALSSFILLALNFAFGPLKNIASIIHEYNHFVDKVLTVRLNRQIARKIKFSKVFFKFNVNTVISNSFKYQ